MKRTLTISIYGYGDLSEAAMSDHLLEISERIVYAARKETYDSNNKIVYVDYDQPVPVNITIDVQNTKL